MSRRSSILGVDDAPTARVRLRQGQVTWWLVYGALLFVSLGVALLAYATVPQPFSLAVVIFVVAALVAIRPTLGVYLVVLLVTIGDTSAVYRSPEPPRPILLFLSHQVKVSPLEVCLVLVGWFLQMLSARRWHLVRGRFFRPRGFTTSCSSPSSTASPRRRREHRLLELRPILYLFIFYIVLTNPMTRQDQFNAPPGA